MYSNVISVWAVTLPMSRTRRDLSSERFYSNSFLNIKPLWSFTFVTTFEAIIGSERIFAKFFVKETGSTLSTFPPVSSASLHNESKLHSSPIIETILIVSPLLFANYPNLS